MIVEKIIAKKDETDFLHYTIKNHIGNALNNNLRLLVDAITSNVFLEILDYENATSVDNFDGWLSDEWNVEYSNKDNTFYVQLYDYWVAQEVADIVNGNLGIHAYKINSLKIKTKDNLFHLIKLSQYIFKHRPLYLIVTQDDQGLIDIEVQNDLPKYI